MRTAFDTYFLGVATVALMLLVSCSNPESMDIVGVWAPSDGAPNALDPRGTGRDVILTDDPILIFREDGEFLFQHFPETLIRIRATNRISSASGHWSIDGYQGMPVVSLRFRQFDGEPYPFDTRIQVTRIGRPKQLYFWLGEEGGPAFVFDRVSSDYDGSQLNDRE